MVYECDNTNIMALHSVFEQTIARTLSLSLKWVLNQILRRRCLMRNCCSKGRVIFLHLNRCKWSPAVCGPFFFIFLIHSVIPKILYSELTNDIIIHKASPFHVEHFCPHTFFEISFSLSVAFFGFWLFAFKFKLLILKGEVCFFAH